MKIPHWGRVLIVVATMKAAIYHVMAIIGIIFATFLIGGSHNGGDVIFFLVIILLSPFAVFGYLAYLVLALSGMKYASSRLVGVFLCISCITGLLLIVLLTKGSKDFLPYEYFSVFLLAVAAIDMFITGEEESPEESGRPSDAKFGVRISLMKPLIPLPRGTRCKVRVEDVYPGSLAGSLGILRGDILTSINGEPVLDCNHAARLLRPEATPKKIVIARGGSPVHISIPNLHL